MGKFRFVEKIQPAELVVRTPHWTLGSLIMLLMAMVMLMATMMMIVMIMMMAMLTMKKVYTWVLWVLCPGQWSVWHKADNHRALLSLTAKATSKVKTQNPEAVLRPVKIKTRIPKNKHKAPRSRRKNPKTRNSVAPYSKPQTKNPNEIW